MVQRPTTQWHNTSPDHGTAYVATRYNGCCSQAVNRGVIAEDAGFTVNTNRSKGGSDVQPGRIGHASPTF
jgi:hypothetical protein